MDEHEQRREYALCAAVDSLTLELQRTIAQRDMLLRWLTTYVDLAAIRERLDAMDNEAGG